MEGFQLSTSFCYISVLQSFQDCKPPYTYLGIPPPEYSGVLPNTHAERGLGCVTLASICKATVNIHFENGNECSPALSDVI